MDVITTTHYTHITPLARYSQNACPFIFDVVGQGKVITGLDRGLIGLCKNSKAHIIIPPHLACKSKHFVSNTKVLCSMFNASNYATSSQFLHLSAVID